MTNEIAIPSDPMKAFQEKIAEKIRSDIADMLPPEAVKALFDKAVDDIFFKATPEIRDSYNHIKQAANPSWFHRQVLESAKPLLEAEIKSRIDEFKPEIEAVIKEHLSQSNVIIVTASVIAKTMADQSRQETFELVNRFMDQLRTSRY